MKYVCRICGYVYDEAKEKIPFADLPDTWVCPLCGAKKSDFEPEVKQEAAKPEKKQVIIDDDMKKLTTGQLSALCSNLARGCEKQYKFREQELYARLADYFAAAVPETPEKDIADISALLEQDLSVGYGNVRAVAGEAKDRGALRVCVWGEKVTRILKGLLERYTAEGEAFLAGTSIWVCTVCGFVYVGENPPALCPVCKVPDWKFEKVEGGAA